MGARFSTIAKLGARFRTRAKWRLGLGLGLSGG